MTTTIVGAVSGVGVLPELSGSGKLGIRDVAKLAPFYLTEITITMSKPRKEGQEPYPVLTAVVLDGENNDCGELRCLTTGMIGDCEALVISASEINNTDMERAALLTYGPFRIVRYRGEYRLAVWQPEGDEPSEQ